MKSNHHGLWTRLAQTWQAFMERRAHARRARRTALTLLEFDDRQLQDIGLRRDEIASVAGGILLQAAVPRVANRSRGEDFPTTWSAQC